MSRPICWLGQAYGRFRYSRETFLGARRGRGGIHARRNLRLRVKPILPSLHELRLGVVNAFLIEDERGLGLIGTGYPGDAGNVLRVAREVGGSDKELRHIFVTHCHADLRPSGAVLRREVLGLIGVASRVYQSVPGSLER